MMTEDYFSSNIFLNSVSVETHVDFTKKEPFRSIVLKVFESSPHKKSKKFGFRPSKFDSLNPNDVKFGFIIL
jgi:hypothetical protein